MDKLPRIIGLAPSEMTPSQLRDKLLNERERVRKGLDYFRNTILTGRQRRGKAPKKASKTTQLNALMKETGLSPQQLLKGIEILKAQATQTTHSPESEGEK